MKIWVHIIMALALLVFAGSCSIGTKPNTDITTKQPTISQEPSSPAVSVPLPTLTTIPVTSPSVQPTTKNRTISQRILILVHGSASASNELHFIQDPLSEWGYSTLVLDHSENFKLMNDNFSGDHWYLINSKNNQEHLELVENGNMQFSVIIFGSGDGSPYSDIETSAKIVKRMFQDYPFVGIVRTENSITFGSNLDNLFQIKQSGYATKSLTINNPANTWALEPMKGYMHKFSNASHAVNVTGETQDVVNLENFDDNTPAITMANYSSGAKAIYFAFKDWGFYQHVSMLIRLIQEYSGIPYKKPYYSYEVDDGGISTIENADYTNLVAWTLANLGGYPTISFEGIYLDQNPPSGILVFDQNPTIHYNNSVTNVNMPSLMALLKTYPEYVIAAHGYQHDRDVWTYTATGLPVNGFADDDGDGIPNWKDDDMEGTGKNNNLNPALKLISGAEFADYDLDTQEMHLSRLRDIFNQYGLDAYHVIITPKYIHLDNYSNTLFARYGFNVVSGFESNAGYTMTPGYVKGTYVPIRVAPGNAPGSPDLALDVPAQDVFKENFWSYIGSHPLALIGSHLPQMQIGATPAYEARDSVLSGYQIMNKAGYKLLTTQSATNKNIGWLWTTISSSKDIIGNYEITLTSAPFSDGSTKHEIDIVMPDDIESVQLGDNYWINVDGVNLYFGKNSNTTEVLHVNSGTYDSAIPRIKSISTPSTDVLNAIYSPVTKEISLTLRGDFVTGIDIVNLKTNSNYSLTDTTTNTLLGNYLSNGAGSVSLSLTPGGEHKYKFIEAAPIVNTGSH